MHRMSLPKQKPLLTLQKPFPVKIYRAKFRPFESTKYLDAKALRAEKKVTIECGHIEFGDLKLTVAAEIHKGMVVALKPMACEGCEPQKPKRARRAVSKAAIRSVQRELVERGLVKPSKPMSLQISRKLGLKIPLGDDITIWILDGDICITIWSGTMLCAFCLYLRVGCILF